MQNKKLGFSLKEPKNPLFSKSLKKVLPNPELKSMVWRLPKSKSIGSGMAWGRAQTKVDLGVGRAGGGSAYHDLVSHPKLLCICVLGAWRSQNDNAFQYCLMKIVILMGEVSLFSAQPAQITSGWSW